MKSFDDSFKVSVFGSSLPKPGEPAYEEALNLGRLLGNTGYTVLTGGYLGTMEAVSRGTAESGGNVIGVTCDEIEAWRPLNPNSWVQEERRFPTFRERIFALIDGCDAAIALPGGIGTLAEISVTWAQMQVSAILPRPLILVGEGWQLMMDSFYASFGNYVPESTQTFIDFAPNVNIAFSQIQSLRS